MWSNTVGTSLTVMSSDPFQGLEQRSQNMKFKYGKLNLKAYAGLTVRGRKQKWRKQLEDNWSVKAPGTGTECCRMDFSNTKRKCIGQEYFKERAQRLEDRLNRGEKVRKKSGYILDFQFKWQQNPRSIYRAKKISTTLGEFEVYAIYPGNYVPKTLTRAGLSCWLLWGQG